MSTGTRPTVLVVNPGADVYGSDLQLLESISAMVDAGWRVAVCVPQPGPLVDLLEGRGAEVLVMRYPVVRRDALSAGGVARFAANSVTSLRSLRRAIRRVRPHVLYVNTVTIPGWLVAGRTTGTPTLCHVHEAETGDNRLVLSALYAPLLLAHRLVLNSRAALDAMASAMKPLRRKSVIVYNGVPEPPVVPAGIEHGNGPFRVAVVGRLSPRKAPDVALEAVALLRRDGRDVHLDICGSTYPGYEWYSRRLVNRAKEPDLAGAVEFSGYRSPIWPALTHCHAVMAPSLREPFGNAVVEAQLVERPVVASAALGHLETVLDGETGLLVPPNDPRAMADAVARLMDDPRLARALAGAARRRALRMFSVRRYNEEIVATLRAMVGEPVCAEPVSDMHVPTPEVAR